MIFRPELAEKILKGEKVQTRRIVKPGEYLYNPIPSVKMVLSKGARTKWEVGQTYAIQPGRTKAGIGRFRLLDIREQQLQDISEADAIAEGVEPLRIPSPEEGEQNCDLVYRPAFASLWNEINGPGAFGANPTVFALTFELVD